MRFVKDFNTCAYLTVVIFTFWYLVFALVNGTPHPHMWGKAVIGWVVISSIVSFFFMLFYAVSDGRLK